MVEKKYNALLCCSKTTHKFILEEGTKEYRRRWPENDEFKVTHDMLLRAMAYSFIGQKVPRNVNYTKNKANGDTSNNPD